MNLENKIKTNMGSLDRTLRTIIGLVLLGVAAFLFLSLGMIVFAIISGIFGVIMLLTSAISFCPLYLPFGISTKK